MVDRGVLSAGTRQEDSDARHATRRQFCAGVGAADCTLLLLEVGATTSSRDEDGNTVRQRCPIGNAKISSSRNETKRNAEQQKGG